MVKLSQSVRPNSEAAPWVVSEIKKMEAAIEVRDKALGDILDGLEWNELQ